MTSDRRAGELVEGEPGGSFAPAYLAADSSPGTKGENRDSDA